MRKSRPTLKDIAAELHLSHPTVSRALAGHPSISEETKARIREAADRLGYVPNSSAQMLRAGRSNIVGLLVPDITNEFYAAVAQRLADDCSEHNRKLLLSISAGDPDRELALVRALMEARPTDLIVALTTTPRPETLAFLRGTHCVQFMEVNPTLEGPSVTVEDSSGARLAMEHLLKLGHRRVGFVGPDPSLPIGDARMRGVKRALAAAGHQLDEELIQQGPSTPEFGYDAVRALLKLPEPPTAIYLSSAPLSLGGMRALSAGAVRIPEEVSVIVAGGTGWYDAWPGGLTSISLPAASLADAASTLLIDPAKEAVPLHIKLSFQLVERGSTAPPPSAR